MTLVLFHQYDQLLAKIREGAFEGQVRQDKLG